MTLTVNHGLRPESAGEVAAVASLCEQWEIPCVRLAWTGPKPSTGLQAAARAARHRLMTAAACEAGADALVLAHHREDQAETFLQRLARGSGVYGLAAMRPADRWGDLTVLRPLLGVPKVRLQATLADAGVTPVQDPSNEDPRFSRVRMRRLLGPLAQEGLTSERIAETAARLGRAAAALDHWVSQLLELAEVHPAGPVRLDLSAIGDLPDEIRYRLLARLVRYCAGADYTPRHEQLEPAADALFGDRDMRRTLAGVVLDRTGTHLRAWREFGRSGIPATVLDGPGSTTWDRRYRIVAAEPGRIEIGPLGPGGLRRLDLARPEAWPASAFEAAPLIRGERGTIVPGFPDLTAPEKVTVTLTGNLNWPRGVLSERNEDYFRGGFKKKDSAG